MNRPQLGGGLARRMIAASVLLALIIGGTFVILLLAIGDLRGAERRNRHAQDVLVATNHLERLVLDLETGLRGFLLTRQERFLQPWTAARVAFPQRIASLQELVHGEPAAEREVREIARRELAYINTYSEPLVDAARRGDASARSVQQAVVGKRRVDAFRVEFDELIGVERRADSRSRSSAETAARRASAAAAVAVGGSIVLIALYAAYLARAIVRPIRRAAQMAGRLAGGDLSARMSETGVGEIGTLERSFNLMGTSLERSQGELAALAAEQAALRRVATLVAGAAPPAAVFGSVAEEVARLFRTDRGFVGRYEPDGTVTVVAGWNAAGDRMPIGMRFPLTEGRVSLLVRESGRPARMGDGNGENPLMAAFGVRSVVAAPISVAAELWGLLAVASSGDPPPEGTEARLGNFSELVGTAIANAQARDELSRIAEEQAALRRVATLVARVAAPEDVFAAVTQEVGQLLPVSSAAMGRFDADGLFTTVAAWTKEVPAFPVGQRWVPEGRNVTTIVLETGRPARMDTFADASGEVGITAREAGYRSAVGTPIIVEGRLWGVMTAASTAEQPLPADTETRLVSFTELVATAIANAQAHAELTASRARIAATADETRRRIERDLHDGAQQRLVSLTLRLRAAQTAVPPELADLSAELDRVVAGLTNAQDELRELSRGIHPAILSEGGLGPALKTLARRSPIPVELDVQTNGRLSEPVEVAAYYVVSEALANAAKHAAASRLTVEVEASDGVLRLRIRDDGIGGADFTRGSGLVGLKDRVEALGGRLELDSEAGSGTLLSVQLPLGSSADPGDRTADGSGV